MKQVLLIRTLHESGSRGAYVGVLKTFEVKETLALSSGGSIGAGKFVISIEVFKNAESASAGMSWCYSMSDVREHERAIKIFREHLFPLHPIALAQYESKLRSLFKHLHEINVICG
jgi:hypothetical protein